VTNQKAKAVLRAESQRDIRKSSTPNLRAKSIPPPRVTMHTGHWALTDEANKNIKEKIPIIRIRKGILVVKINF